MKGMTVIKTGILATVQDLGRRGYARLGINPGGPMDTAAARIANALCGNDETDAVLEMHFPAPVLEFETEARIAVTGGEFGASVSGRPLPNWKLASVKAGDVLTFSERRSGARAYLAVSGGLDGDEWLGSRSTNLTARIGGIGGRTIMRGDRLSFRRPSGGNRPQLAASPRLIPFYSAFPTVRFVAGPEFSQLTNESRRLICEGTFEVSHRSNRMGLRLSGPDLALSQPIELVSSGANFGTVQLLPDGQLIVLMADHQTTGGYPRVASIIPTDIPLIAQVGLGGKVAFHETATETAEELFFRFERDLKMFRTACKFRLDAFNRS